MALLLFAPAFEENSLLIAQVLALESSLTALQEKKIFDVFKPIQI